MISDKAIYQKIGNILLSEYPSEAISLSMFSFDLSEDGSACSFKFHFTDKDNKTSWYIPTDPVATEILTDLLFELRKSFINNNQDLWNKFNYTLDTITGKFEVDFKYPDQNV